MVGEIVTETFRKGVRHAVFVPSVDAEDMGGGTAVGRRQRLRGDKAADPFSPSQCVGVSACIGRTAELARGDERRSLAPWATWKAEMSERLCAARPIR